MDIWQKVFVLAYGGLSLVFSIKGLYESAKKGNAYGVTRTLFWLGIFVWGDAVIFGFFWFLASLISYLLNDWLLFLLIISVFWVVRSLGEAIFGLTSNFRSLNAILQKNF